MDDIEFMDVLNATDNLLEYFAGLGLLNSYE
jgi:hypothetical protein